MHTFFRITIIVLNDARVCLTQFSPTRLRSNRMDVVCIYHLIIIIQARGEAEVIIYAGIIFSIMHEIIIPALC